MRASLLISPALVEPVSCVQGCTHLGIGQPEEAEGADSHGDYLLSRVEAIGRGCVADEQGNRCQQAWEARPLGQQSGVHPGSSQEAVELQEGDFDGPNHGLKMLAVRLE